MLEDFIRLIQALQGNPFSAPAFFLLYTAACFIAPVSVFPVAGGVLFGFWGGLAINLLSTLTGASGAFLVARRWGRGRLKSWLPGLTERHPLILKLDNPGPGAFILIRLLGLPPFVITNYLAGLSRLNFRRFLWASALGLLPWTCLMTFFADTFWGILRVSGVAGFRRALLDRSLPLLWGAGVLAGTMCATVLWQRRMKWKSAPGGSDPSGRPR